MLMQVERRRRRGTHKFSKILNCTRMHAPIFNLRKQNPQTNSKQHCCTTTIPTFAQWTPPHLLFFFIFNNGNKTVPKVLVSNATFLQKGKARSFQNAMQFLKNNNVPVTSSCTIICNHCIASHNCYASSFFARRLLFRRRWPVKERWLYYIVLILREV